MRHQSYRTFGLMVTLPFLLASSETANLSEINVERVPSPPAEVQPVVEIPSEPVLLREEPQVTQPETKNRREGREYCQGIGVC